MGSALFGAVEGASRLISLAACVCVCVTCCCCAALSHVVQRICVIECPAACLLCTSAGTTSGHSRPVLM